MSWHFSQVLEAEYSAGSCSDGAQSAPSSGTDMHGTFWSPGKTTVALKPSRSGMMFKPLTDDLGEGVLMSYLEAFPVRTFHAPEKVQESKASEAPCGNTWRELSVKFDLATHTWKTHQCLWEEDLQPSSLTLPRWGMTQGGVLWERTTSPLPTSEIESGLAPNGVDSFHTPNTTGLDGGSNSRKALRKRQEIWPTPRAGKTTDENEETWMIRHKAGKVATPPLSLAVKMWPTPQVDDAKNSGKNQTRRETLASRIWKYPTPGANEDSYRLNGNSQQSNSLGAIARREALEESPESGGQLNPTWVEWLMGWPLGWTDCAASATDKFRQWLNSHGKH